MSGSKKQMSGMRGFTIAWIGQVISLLGTAMSNFALTLWAYEITGKATPLALVGFFFITPMMVLGPFVGTLIDRGNRKLMMMLSDLAAALTMLVVLTLYLSDALQIWHLYVAAVVTGTFQGFQWPAYSAAISLMVPKEHYTRANGMLELAGESSYVVAPLMAGALIGPLGVNGILTIDIFSAAFATLALLLVHVPQPEKSEAGQEAEGSFFQEAVYGFRYIFSIPSLLGLQLVFLAGNFFNALAYPVLAPMILGRTSNDEIIFGSVLSIGAIGGVIGGLLMSSWGGFKRRIHGVLLGWILAGFLGQMVAGLGQSLLVWALGIFVISFFTPMLKASNQAIWQSKVPPDVQGRVFATRRLIAWFAIPLGHLLAGPLSDRVMEPAMVEGGILAQLFGPLLGIGIGSGIGLLFVITGILVGLSGLAGYLIPIVRDVEAIIPDHDTASHSE
jgi:MFS family permease